MSYRFSILAILLAILPQFAYATPLETGQQRFPNVEAVQVRSSSPDRFDFDVTISSRYDTPKRYADAFRVIGKDGHVFGERVLLHDHADEQPFTRDLHGVKIPAEIRKITIQARDKKFGYGGKSVEVMLPGR